MVININKSGELFKTQGHKVLKEDCPTAYEVLYGTKKDATQGIKKELQGHYTAQTKNKQA